MKTTVLRSVLKEGVSMAERATAKSPTLPVLSNILLTAKGNALELVATDLEIAIRYQALAKNKKEGQAAVPSRVLSQLLAASSENSVELQATESQLTLRTKEYTTNIKAADPDDFPVIPSLKGDEQRVEVEAETFCAGLAQVASVTGQSQTRPEISGVFFSFEGGSLRVAATDSFRLAEKTISLHTKNSAGAAFILPQKAARELVSIFGDKQGRLALSVSPTQVIFEYNGSDDGTQPQVQLVSRVIEGEYPQYREVIPGEFQAKATVDRNELLNRVRAASIFAGKGNEVRIALDPENKLVEVSARSGDVGESTALVPAEVAGKEAGAASFNWRFLAEGLSLIKDTTVQLGLNGEEGASALIPRQEERYVYVLMPIKA